jgi:hypothetical protein
MDLALPRPHLLIAEARERQRRRRLRLLRAVAALAVLATAGYALSERLGSPAIAAEQAALPNACALLTNADVAKVFGAKVAYRSYEQYGGCTWLGRPFERQYGQQTMTLAVARASQADFDRFSTVVVSDGPGLRRVARSTAVQGVGNAAFAQIFAARDLEVFYGGLVVSIKTTFVSSQLRAEKRLAQAAVERIRAAEART